MPEHLKKKEKYSKREYWPVSEKCPNKEASVESEI